MFFEDVMREGGLEGCLEKLKDCKESCQTEEAIECLEYLEFMIEDRLEGTQEFSSFECKDD